MQFSAEKEQIKSVIKATESHMEDADLTATVVQITLCQERLSAKTSYTCKICQHIIGVLTEMRDTEKCRQLFAINGN